MARRERKEPIKYGPIQSPWVLRVSNANRYYKEWEDKFKCDRLESYYEGFQHRHLGGYSGRRPYVLNLVYAAIKRKVAHIVYSEPEFILKPQPGGIDWNQDLAVQSVNLKQDTLNTLISNPNLNFVDNIRLAALDSFFRFAVMEPGYSADWINPQKPHLLTTSHYDPTIPENKDKVIEDEEVLAEERVYAKWVSARRFRVSTSDDPHLRNCLWAGYYSFMSKDVLANTKGIAFPTRLRDRYYSVDIADATAYFSSKSEISKETLSALSRGEVCKVWNLWDNVTGERLLLLDGMFEELYAEDFERINLNTFRFDLSLKGWLPIPPVWQWLSSQDEVNECREQMRRYRRRFTRKYEVQKNTVEPDELDKFKNEEDGEIIETKGRSPDGGPVIKPIQNPEIGISISEGLVVSKDDFNIISSNTVARGRSSDRQTATATNVQAQAEELAQSVEQVDFSRFICAVGRELLLQAGENFETGLWVKLNQEPSVPEQLFADYAENQEVYKWVTAQDINDGYDFTIKINVTNAATPAQIAAEEVAFIKFLDLTTKYPQIAMSPALIREAAYRVGYRNEKIIKEMQKMAMLALMEKANLAGRSLVEQGLLSGEQLGGGASQNMLTSAQPNNAEEIQAQMMQQLGG